MTEYIDITLPVSPSLPVRPGSLAIKFDKIFDMYKGDPHTDTEIHLSAHTGPHIDAPSHFVKEGKNVSEFPVEKMIGVDYLSIQPFHRGPETHQIILGAEIIALEGVNLASVAPGNYELICLPMRLMETGAAPAGVLLRKI